VCDRDDEWLTTSAMATFDGIDSFIHSWVCWHISTGYCVAPSSSRSVGYVVTILAYCRFTPPKNVPGCDNGSGCDAKKHRFKLPVTSEEGEFTDDVPLHGSPRRTSEPGTFKFSYDTTFMRRESCEAVEQLPAIVLVRHAAILKLPFLDSRWSGVADAMSF
jgi:hypothetical protein